MRRALTLPRRIAKRINREAGFLKRRIAAPPPVRSPDGQLRIHIGCGEINSQEFVNVDALPYPHVHYVRNDMMNLDMFEDGSADLIYMCHVLEHVARRDLHEVLTELHRVLRPRGVLRISVPDFDLIVEMYRASGSDVSAIADPLLGSHANPYDVHYAIFNARYLTKLFKDAGFSSVREWLPEACQNHDFDDWASRKIVRDGREFAVSLNLEAVK